MELRDYQQEAVDALFTWWRENGAKSAVLVLPTGAGKTVIFSHILRALIASFPSVRVLVLAHRKELIAQAESKLLRVWPEAPVGVYAASLERREIRQITIASRDSIAPVIGSVGRFDFAIVDEAHNVNTEPKTRYAQIVESLRAANPTFHVVGFTATPYRQKMGAIYGKGKAFEGLAYRLNIARLISEGFLCEAVSLRTDAGAKINTKGVRVSSTGDYNGRELSHAAVSSDAALAVRQWDDVALSNGRKATVFFCVSVAHAELVSKAVEDISCVECPIVTGKTPQADRDRLLADFARGKFRAIANVGVLTEGWDAPIVDCIVLLRPTRSQALYVQMIGRGLRVHEGKENCLVLDYGGCLERFGPIDEVSAREPGTPAEVELVECVHCNTLISSAKRICPLCGRRVADEPQKPCKECGELIAASARVCQFCNTVQVTHEVSAATGRVLSYQEDKRVVAVLDTTFSVKTAHKTGIPYFMVTFLCDDFEKHKMRLFFENTGFPRKKAEAQWRIFGMDGETIPDTAAQALEISPRLRTPCRITVDYGTRWKDVLALSFTWDDGSEREFKTT